MFVLRAHRVPPMLPILLACSMVQAATLPVVAPDIDTRFGWSDATGMSGGSTSQTNRFQAVAHSGDTTVYRFKVEARTSGGFSESGSPIMPMTWGDTSYVTVLDTVPTNVTRITRGFLGRRWIMTSTAWILGSGAGAPKGPFTIPVLDNLDGVTKSDSFVVRLDDTLAVRWSLSDSAGGVFHGLPLVRGIPFKLDSNNVIIRSWKEKGAATRWVFSKAYFLGIASFDSRPFGQCDASHKVCAQTSDLKNSTYSMVPTRIEPRKSAFSSPAKTAHDAAGRRGSTKPSPVLQPEF